MAKNQGGDKQSKAEKLRVLFGKGILRSSGKRGKDGERKVTYHPEAGRTAQAKGRRSAVQRLRKSGAVGKVSRRYRNTPGPNSGRHVFGAKAAHLRGSGTGSGQTGAKRMLLNPQRHDGSRKASGPAPANIKFPASKSAAPASSKGNPAHAATRAARLAAAQKVLGKSKAAQYVADMRRYQGMSPGIAAHARAIAAKQRVTTLKKRLTKLQRDNGTGGKKVDHSATRAARVAAGREIANYNRAAQAFKSQLSYKHSGNLQEAKAERRATQAGRATIRNARAAAELEARRANRDGRAFDAASSLRQHVRSSSGRDAPVHGMREMQNGRLILNREDRIRMGHNEAAVFALSAKGKKLNREAQAWLQQNPNGTKADYLLALKAKLRKGRSRGLR